MEELLVINDDSKSSLHAAEYSFMLACIYRKNIVIANVVSSSQTIPAGPSHFKSGAGEISIMLQDDEMSESLAEHLCSLKSAGFKPGIKTLDASKLGEREIIAHINAQKCWMVVHGAGVGPDLGHGRHLNIQTILNRIQCPIVVVPETAPLVAPERLVYLVDLRYAQVPVINFLGKLQSGKESVILAHICARGLPELDKSYASDLFSNGLSRNSVCSNLHFTQLRAKGFADAIDAALHGIQADILVCCNHTYHFEQLFGRGISFQGHLYVTVPVMVFPH